MSRSHNLIRRKRRNIVWGYHAVRRAMCGKIFVDVEDCIGRDKSLHCTIFLHRRIPLVVVEGEHRRELERRGPSSGRIVEIPYLA